MLVRAVHASMDIIYYDIPSEGDGDDSDDFSDDDEEDDDDEDDEQEAPVVPPLPNALHVLITRMAAHAPDAAAHPYPAPFRAAPSPFAVRHRDREPPGFERVHARARDTLNRFVWDAAGVIAQHVPAPTLWDRLRAHTEWETGAARPVEQAGARELVARRLHAAVNADIAAPPPFGQHMLDAFDASDYVGGTLMQSMSQRGRWGNADLWRAVKHVLPAEIVRMWAGLHAPPVPPL